MGNQALLPHVEASNAEPSFTHKFDDVAPYSDTKTTALPPAYSSVEPEAATSSTLPTASNFAAISLNMTDRIRLLHFDAADIARIRDIVVAAWPNGIQSTRTYNASQEFQLKGYPWVNVRPKLPATRNLLQGLLAGLHDMGWEHEACFVLDKKPDHKDTLFFRRRQQKILPSRSDWMNIAADDLNVLSIQNGPDDLCSQLSRQFSANGWSRETALNVVDPGLEQAGINKMEIRLKKVYWQSQGQDTVVVRLMMMTLVETLEAFGFRVYVTIRAGTEGDLLVCRRVDAARPAANQGLLDA